jgi:2-methylaconitate cis-trans-isomerase PrpF
MTTLSGRELGPTDMDIAIRMISMGMAHRAVPITGALCLAVACRIAGSVPHRVSPPREGQIRVAHPSGVTVVDAMVATDGALPVAESCAVYRTTRRLFEGTVLYRAEETA